LIAESDVVDVTYVIGLRGFRSPD